MSEKKRILVTGGEGFIGSNFIRYLIENSDAFIVNYDKKTYAGQGENLKDIENFYPNYVPVLGDICDRERVKEIMGKHDINYIVNFAAESHVDRSIKNPEDFNMTNYFGTGVLLEAAREKGIEKFIQIGTDEVYGSLDEDSPSSKETDVLKPSSPYSASKSGADNLALSYFKTYEFPVCITRSSNNYGPYQYPEKMVPLFVTNLLEEKKVPLYGDGKNIRDWLHVEDNCRAINLVLEKGKPGEIYNIGAEYEFKNIEVTRAILGQMGFDQTWIEYVEDRKGHDRRYSMDCSKIKKELGWRALICFEDRLIDTIEWYEKNENWWRRLK